MVRHDRRHHDISKREEEERQHRGIGASHLYDLTEDAVYEHHAVEGAEHLYGSHDEDGTVDAGELHQSLVDEVRHIHVERQQRVAVHVVACQPVAHDRIGDGVKARDVEVVYKQRPVPPCDGREEVIILAQHKGIQSQQGHQHNKGKPSLLVANAEDIEYFFHFLRKNLTSTKFTGTQMQNIGIGASLSLTPIQRKKWSVAICRR